MRVVDTRALQAYCRRPGNEAAEPLLCAWHAEVKAANWNEPSEVNADYPLATFESDGSVVFDLDHGRHVLVARMNYSKGIVLIMFVGTASEFRMQKLMSGGEASNEH